MVFHVCRISWSWIPSSAACRSRKSKRDLIAFGRGRPRGTAKIAWNRSFTYGWRIRCGGKEEGEKTGDWEEDREGGGVEGWGRQEIGPWGGKDREGGRGRKGGRRRRGKWGRKEVEEEREGCEGREVREGGGREGEGSREGKRREKDKAYLNSHDNLCCIYSSVPPWLTAAW